MRLLSNASVGTFVAACAVAANAESLADVCTLSNVKSVLPSNGTLLGINLITSASTTAVVYNATVGGGMSSSGSSQTYDYCNATLTYIHPGNPDTNIIVKYAFPEPADFKNRFYVAGGGGYSLNTDSTGGLPYGAAAGATSAGYDALNGVGYDDAVLLGNGSINWDATYMFAYQALGEMTQIGKYVTKGLYGLSTSSKLYTYYEGCSDGGREGMSQQQVNHVFSAEVEKVLGYYPPPCELAKIVNATIKACDPLDDRTDGVISRTDLCMLDFDLSSIISEEYYCAASTTSSGSPGGSSSSSYQPVQSGKVSKEGVAVAKAIYASLHNSKGQRAYLSWQIGSQFGDAGTEWNNSTDAWELSITSTGGEWVTKFVELLDLDNLSTLDGVTYDTLVSWMETGFVRFSDSLQTTVPDLTKFQSSGGKLLHYHGESDPSIPSASSVHYWQSVRSVMYPDVSSEASLKALRDWYQFYLIPGAAHCGTNTLQPGPYPEDNMEIMIDWVENGVTPTRLNATVSSGDYEGETQMLCQWPSRPLWRNNATFDCVYDEKSIKTWTYDFPAFKIPVY
ncbi:tannase and feruloyl esterase family protein [Penicillium longicatenatum]|uniref:tannase and feruloyl esterase family protein n=1 Tax=Penicillium longicatenatum TaxID=1561947 RepID=UPI002549693E|nr:tannase and feruloyl esterase family protein [Penicillium longicatenatum]KAJ5649996.1 tannase and feruloyl esterase family protein [Penicillium longicatenatum]